MRTFDFKDINLIPKYFDGVSRQDIDTSIKLGKHIFKNPIIPANMESVINEDLCEKLASNGYFYIMHRFNVNQLEFIKKFKEKKLITSISLGVNKSDLELVHKMVSENLIPDYITIDIAHGHSRMMKEALIAYRKLLPDTFIIAGNISTQIASFDLEQWGANAIKVGIANGAVCLTYMETGFGSRGIHASVIENIIQHSNIPVIADGGIAMPGDITKSLVLGATMCMCGGLFSGCFDSPGNTVEKDGILYKEYYGSASEFNTGKTNRIEGTKKLIKSLNITLLERMTQLEESLQSSISYGGGKCLTDLKYVRYIFNN